jgi:type I restriction enzyme, S subunit
MVNEHEITEDQGTEFGFLPDGWDVKELNGEIDLLTGFPFQSKNYSKEGIKLLRGANVKRGVTDWSKENIKYWKEVTPDLRELKAPLKKLAVKNRS